jgi:uncharacterized protein YndB with AHSA1/START domain
MNVVEKTLHLSATPDRVWRALTNPRELGQWFPDRTDLHPGVGNTGWFDWEDHGKFAVRIDEVSPLKRLVWTWAREPGIELEEGHRTTVEWTLEPRSDGGTTLHLRESGFVDPASRDQNDQGWDKELRELVEYLQGGASDKRARA